MASFGNRTKYNINTNTPQELALSNEKLPEQNGTENRFCILSFPCHFDRGTSHFIRPVLAEYQYCYPYSISIDNYKEYCFWHFSNWWHQLEKCQKHYPNVQNDLKRNISLMLRFKSFCTIDDQRNPKTFPNAIPSQKTVSFLINTIITKKKQ